MAANDPRTVKVRHPEKGTHKVTPEVAAVLDRQGWERVGAPASDIDAAVESATAPLKARIAELEAQLAAKDEPIVDNQVPDRAEDVITWIGDDQAKAAAALEAEKARPVQRKTVTDHITSVLNPTTPPSADTTGGQSAKED